LIKEKTGELEMLFDEFKDVFTWTYKNMKDILLELAQHKIELDTSIPPAHQARNKLNPNCAVIVKHDIDKLLTIGFFQPIEKAAWLSPIVIVPKKNNKLKNCEDFRKLNKATKKNPYPLPFSDEVLNTLAGYEAYSFLDRYSGYHHIFIAPKDRYKTTFVANWGAFV